jgi:hypothetical protein
MACFPSPHAYYAADLATFVGSTSGEILGDITANTAFAVELEQRDAWLTQIEILQGALAEVKGAIFLEFNVPRIGSRLDAVLLTGPTIVAIEFKIGESKFKRDHLNQVWDYALDLKNFHKASHAAPILPILVATNAAKSDKSLAEPHADGVFPPARCNTEGLRHLVCEGLTDATGEPLDARRWGESPYQPTPTIIEAAQPLLAARRSPCRRNRSCERRRRSITKNPSGVPESSPG